MVNRQYLLNDESAYICKMCRGKLVMDPSTSERICSTCGTVNEVQESNHPVFQSPLSLGSETQMPLSDSALGMTYDLNLPTVISNKSTDAHGREIQGNYEMSRLRNLNTFTIYNDSKWRNLSKAIDEIRRITDMMGLGNVVAERAYQTYRKCYCDGITRGKMISGVAMASVWVACKELGIARSDREIENVMKGKNTRGVRRYYHLLLRQLKFNYSITDASFFIPRIAKRAGLGGKTERKALEILAKVKDDPSLIGKRPVSLAAAALYFASALVGEPVTQMRIANAAEVTPITIRNRGIEIAKILGDHGIQKTIPLEQRT